jgi:hypothetical protein
VQTFHARVHHHQSTNQRNHHGIHIQDGGLAIIPEITIHQSQTTQPNPPARWGKDKEHEGQHRFQYAQARGNVRRSQIQIGRIVHYRPRTKLLISFLSARVCFFSNPKIEFYNTNSFKHFKSL